MQSWQKHINYSDRRTRRPAPARSGAFITTSTRFRQRTLVLVDVGMNILVSSIVITEVLAHFSVGRRLD